VPFDIGSIEGSNAPSVNIGVYERAYVYLLLDKMLPKHEVSRLFATQDQH
jgi:hypothetical protein